MIYWDLLLGTEDIKGALKGLYSELSIAALAEHLGVSKTALRRQLILHGIPIRRKGKRNEPTKS